MNRFVFVTLSTVLLCACSAPSNDSASNGANAPTPSTASEYAPAASPQPVETASGVKLYTLNCGEMQWNDVDGFADDGSMKGVPRRFVDSCYLIRHPKGDLVWDTGVPESIADLPDGFRGDGGNLHIVVPRKLSAQLAELGLTAADIEFVSFSHSHFDHVGNGGLFAASTWIVDADERAAMFSEQARAGQSFAAYAALENATTLQIQGDDTHDVFGDDSVVIHQTPGHTPGHTVLRVKTANAGAVLLTGDMWHLAESRERRLVPRFNVDRNQTLASMDEVETLAATHQARIVRQHVPEDFDSLPKFPLALE